MSSDVRRTFDVTKDDGSHWHLQYTVNGARWVPATPPVERVASSQPPPQIPLPGAAPAQAIAAVGEAAALLLNAWETRQRRLSDEAAHEEARHSQWLIEMIGRWGEVHSGADRVDLLVSEYLARQAKVMMDTILANKRVALPQSVLYELASIQDVLKSYRQVVLGQFEALARDVEIDLAGTIEAAMPQRKIDLDFITDLAADPEIEWGERVVEKTTADFDKSMTVLLKSPTEFQRRLFPTTAVAVTEPAENKQLGLAQRIKLILTPALPRPFLPDYKPDASDKRDLYRELTLLPTEVARAKALTAAWLATSEVVSAVHGGQLKISAGSDGLQVAVDAQASRLPIER